MIVAGFEFSRMTRYPSSLQNAQRLGARVVEFTCLADDDRPGTDYEYGFEVIASRHQPTPDAAAAN